MEENKLEIKRVGPLSIGKILGAIYATIGLIFGAIFSCVSLVGAAAAAAATDVPIFGFIFGIGAVFIMPIFYGGMGFLTGLIVAAVYNFAASRIGGIELDLAPQRLGNNL